MQDETSSGGEERETPAKTKQDRNALLIVVVIFVGLALLIALNMN